VLIDLHTHTRPGSPDSFLDPDELIERSKQAGLDAVVLSEHDKTWDRQDLQALAKRHNFLIIPGLEVSTEGGHILVYGVHRYQHFMRQSQQLAAHVKQQQATMIAAHPYRAHALWSWHDPDERQRSLARAATNPAYNHVHAVEVLNGHDSPTENKFSEDLAKLLGRPGTAGTDSHQRSDIGKAATYFDSDVGDEHDLVREILAGRCWAVDLTAGSLTENSARHTVPSSVAEIAPPLGKLSPNANDDCHTAHS